MIFGKLINLMMSLFFNRQILQAPKSRLPSHDESFNPPGEYLFNNHQKKIY